MRNTLASLIFLALAAACATDSEDSATPREAAQTGPLVGRTIEFALDVDALDHATMSAIGQRIEQQTGAESVSIEVRKSDDDGTTVVVQAWGRAAIGDDALSADLRAQFPALENAIISINPLAGEGPADGPTRGLGDLEVDKDEDPEVVKQQVIEQLRAKGVQGDVEVHIDDHDDGKREVRVEVKDEKHLTSPQ
jgi:hypothetical protein